MAPRSGEVFLALNHEPGHPSWRRDLSGETGADRSRADASPSSGLRANPVRRCAVRALGAFSAIRQASRESGRPVRELFAEAIGLRLGIGRLGLLEYLDYRLYLNDLDAEQKSAFGGWRAQQLLERLLVDDYSRFLSLDKLTMYALMRGLGFPIPELRAVYGLTRPQSFTNLGSPEALADYLQDGRNLPVYLKPAFGAYGRGNTLILGVEGDQLRLGDGSSVSVRSFCESLNSRASLGWLLQQPLCSHPDLAEVCGDKISSVRIHTFLGAGGPEVVSALLKVNAGAQDCDNFRHGESGNLLGALDIATGRVTRVVSGTGSTQKLVEQHPRSGKCLIDLQLPAWQAVVALALDAQLAFPGYLCPGWDIAICPDGPKILEVNYFGDIDLPQHAYRRGFLDDKLIALMKSRGLDLASSGESACSRFLRLNGRSRLRVWPW